MKRSIKPKGARVTAAKARQAECAENARLLLDPALLAGVTNAAFTGNVPELDPVELADALRAQSEAISNGSMERAEAILMTQAHTLDVVFNQLSRRAAANMGSFRPAFETYLRLALKAQSQCRSTLEALAAIKNPATVAFVRQANVATGPQQVINGHFADPRDSRAGGLVERPNRLLEPPNEQRLDARTTQAPSDADTPMEAVGKLDRPKNRRR